MENQYKICLKLNLLFTIEIEIVNSNCTIEIVNSTILLPKIVNPQSLALEQIAQNIHVFHVVTSSDTTSALFSKGKAKGFKVLGVCTDVFPASH